MQDLYDSYYFRHGCGSQPYERNDGWLRFFDSIAERIVRDIGPTSVLDAGCAMGFLVEALRTRGVEAFGMDISEYAIQQVHPDIQPYCWVGSVTAPLPRRYDLIVCIEVLEHLSPREAEQAIENFCQHTDDILFSSTPFDYQEATHRNVRPPDYWAELFARNGFFRDVDFDASFITPWAIRLRRTREPVARIIATYERRLWQLDQEIRARRDVILDQRNKLAENERTVEELTTQVQRLTTQVQRLTFQVKEWERRWAYLEASMGWAVLTWLQRWRARLAPPHSLRDQFLEAMVSALRTRRFMAVIGVLGLATGYLWRQIRMSLWRVRLQIRPAGQGQVIQVDPIHPRPPVSPHQATVDIIICVHNALSDVQRCLDSVVRHTTPPYSIILVDDGSDAPTHEYLSAFAARQGATLLHNQNPQGYTRAANQGLRSSSADFVVLLNSDTVVTEGWVDRLIACAESDPRIGIVGPLANTASWQSIPAIFDSDGDWAVNPLPPGADINDMGRLVARYSGRLYPTMPFLNGFCLLIRRELLNKIGYFDEETFGPGYGEEDDYALRARQAGWRLALADDTYIYHAQSRSYSNEKRRQLSDRAGMALAQKHGQAIISEGVAFCRGDRVLEGIRARSRFLAERDEWIRKGRERFSGRRILFILPIAEPGGGGNVVIDEAMAMHEMGVDVHLFNLETNRLSFERGYPDLPIPVFYGTRDDLGLMASNYDAVVATVNFSVKWLALVAQHRGRPVRGYYIQGFEPYIYAQGTVDFQTAWNSYTLFPDLIRFTKTEWTRDEVKRNIGVDCSLVGVSVDIDLFRPRPRSGPEWPERPLRIAALVRPSTPVREPKLTMEILRRASHRYRGAVEIILFGTTLKDPDFAALPRDFAWRLAGILSPKQVARLLNEVDIFVDFSSHQAMGLTALEAMACGAAVIVPERGGATSFARHEENSLVVDTSAPETCWHALRRLLDDHELRTRLQRQALVDVCAFFPERPAFNILSTLFDHIIHDAP